MQDRINTQSNSLLFANELWLSQCWFKTLVSTFFLFIVWHSFLIRDGQCAEYSGEEQAICAVGLAKSKPGVFVEAIQYLLILATPVEVVTNPCSFCLLPVICTLKMFLWKTIIGQMLFSFNCWNKWNLEWYNCWYKWK